jgi:hypothetical protein
MKVLRRNGASLPGQRHLRRTVAFGIASVLGTVMAVASGVGMSSAIELTDGSRSDYPGEQSSPAGSEPPWI